MTQQEITKIIKEYEALGFVMFPVTKDKVPPPAMKRWQDFLKSPMLTDTLIYWVFERGMSLAAITSDQTFYVADDDYPKHGGERPANTEMESTVVAKTQNGGFHYYYKPFNMKNKQNIKLSKTEFFHIDLRGNSPGYVLIPPFGGYAWVKPPTKQALENLPDKPPQVIFDIWNSKKELSPDDVETSDFFEILNLSEFRDPLLFERSFILWQNHYKNPAHYTPVYIASVLNDFNSQFNPPKSKEVLEKVFKQGQRYATRWANEQGIIKVIEKAPVLQPSKMTDEELSSSKEYPMLKVDIKELDQIGIPSGLNLIIGQSGGGKSWFLNHLVKTGWELNKQRSVIFSLEMDFEGLKKRMLQSYSGYTAEQMKSSPNLTAGIKTLKEADPIIYDYTQVDRGGITPLSISQAIHQQYALGRRIFLLDHFMEIPGISTNEKNQGLTEIWGDAFKAIRNTYSDVWLFILVQANKEGYKKDIITKEYTRGSSALIDKCDFFISLNRKEKPDPSVVLDLSKPKDIIFWVDKNRRSIADRFAVSCVLDATGNFHSTGEYVFTESIEEDEDTPPW